MPDNTQTRPYIAHTWQEGDTITADLLNAITTTENWAELVNNGSINGTALITSDTNVKAIGSPTLELWRNGRSSH